MPLFDLRSFIVMGSAMAVLMAAVLGLMRLSYPSHIRGLGPWAAAPVLWLLSSLLYAARGNLHPLLSVVAANALLMCGATLYYAGCGRFLAQRISWRFWGLYLGAATLAFAALTFIWQNYAARLGLFTLLMAGIYGANLRLLLRHGGTRLPTRLVQLLLALHLAVLLARLLSVWFGQSGTDLLQPSGLQAVYIGSYVVTVLMLSVGAVLLATDRLVSEFEHLATHDALTQTFNRRAVLQHCRDELARCRRHDRGLALMMLDLDHFKNINDTHGHDIGDMVLAETAAVIKDCCREGDVAARTGGEEFVLLLINTVGERALAFAEDLRGRVEARRPGGIPVTVSVGVAETATGAPTTFEALFKAADDALYDAKETGRNRVVKVSL